MDLDKIGKLASLLKHAELLKETDKGRFYQTNHEQYRVDISQDKDAGYREQPLYGSFSWNDDMVFSFKNSSGNEEFEIRFKLYTDGGSNSPTNKSINLFVNNVMVNDEVKKAVFEKINFNDFIDNELEKAKNQFNTNIELRNKKLKDEELNREQAIDNIILKLNRNDLNPELDINQLKKEVNTLSIKTDRKIVSNAGRNLFKYYEDGLEGDIKIYQEKFESFDVTYKESNRKDMYGKDNKKMSLSFTNAKDGTNFTFNVVPHFGLIFDNQYIRNGELTNELFVKCGADRFLTSLLDKVNTLSLAESAQWKINQEVSKIKTEDLLTDDPSAKKINFDNMPIEINGAKVWINSELKLDRKDGPAIENYDGKDFWFDNGQAILPIVKVKEPTILNKLADAIVPSSVDDSTRSMVSNVVNKFRNMFSSNDNSSKKRMN